MISKDRHIKGKEKDTKSVTICKWGGKKKIMKLVIIYNVIFNIPNVNYSLLLLNHFPFYPQPFLLPSAQTLPTLTSI